MESIDQRGLAARFVLGLVSDSCLPLEGVRLLQGGIDTKVIRRLAGLGPESGAEARTLFLEVLREWGLDKMSRREAVDVAALRVCEQILEGAIQPLVGAEEIWTLTEALGAPPPAEFQPLIYAASEHRDRPWESELFESQAVAAAREVVGSQRVPGKS